MAKVIGVGDIPDCRHHHEEEYQQQNCTDFLFHGHLLLVFQDQYEYSIEQIKKKVNMPVLRES